MKPLLLGLLGIFTGIFLSWLYITISFCPSWDSSLRSNGHDWFCYDSAFIQNIQCQVVTVKDGSHSIEVTDQKKISEIEEWIASTGIMDRMNYSPKWPSDQPWFTTSTVLPAFEIRLTGKNASASNESTEIMTIPLTPLTLGVDKKQYSEKINELKKIVQTSIP